MKKSISLILVVLICFSLSSCTAKTATAENDKPLIVLPESSSTDISSNTEATEKSEVSEEASSKVEESQNSKTEETSKVTQSVSSDTMQSTPSQNATHYLGNKNTKKFHKSTCSFAKKIKSENLITFESREEAINGNYAPCGKCNP